MDIENQVQDQEINAIDEIVKGNIDALCELTQEGFMTFISMTMELYCARHDLDVVETAQDVAAVVTIVNEARQGLSS